MAVALEPYTEFFRTELRPVFESVFSLIEGAASWEELNNPNSFFEFTSDLNRKALGRSADGNPRHGYLVSALPLVCVILSQPRELAEREAELTEQREALARRDARVRELEDEVARLRLPPKTPENSLGPPSRG